MIIKQNIIDMLDKKLEVLYREADSKDELQKDIYYYTSVQNLPNIFKERKLFMPDFKEKIGAEFEYTIGSLKRLVPNKPLPYKMNCEGTELTTFWEAIEWYIKERVSCYRLSSFSLDRENNYMRLIFGGIVEGIIITFAKEYFQLSQLALDPTLINSKESAPIPVRTRIGYDKGSEGGYLKKFSDVINEYLEHMDSQNQEDILEMLYGYIIAWLPKFLTPDLNPYSKNEYRVYYFDNLLHPVFSVKEIELNGEKGIYSPIIKPEFIKEMLCSIEKYEEVNKIINNFPEFKHIKVMAIRP